MPANLTKVERIELYTCKLETAIKLKSAKMSIIVSVQRGSVEDVNEAMNTIVAKLRELDEEKEDAS